MANIIITKEILDAGRSSRGFWSMKQIKIFGITSFSVSLPKTVIGKEFPEELVKEFLALKDKHLTPEQISAATDKSKSFLPLEPTNQIKSLSTSQIKTPASPSQTKPGAISFNIIMTDHIIEKAKSSAGGWSRQQLDIIGVKTTDENGRFKIPTGWKLTVIGKEYPNDVIQKFVELKDQHISTKKKNINTVPPFNLNLDLDI